MYDDVKEMLVPHIAAPLDTTQTTHSIPDLDSETVTRYSEDTNPQRDLVQLQEYFQQFQERLNQLGPTKYPPTHIEELTNLTEKLQQLAIMLQPCSPCRPVDKPIHTAMHQYTDTLCLKQWQTILTTSLLQYIPTFNGQDTNKLEDWLNNIEKATHVTFYGK